jgi:hypothetical protein
MATCRDFPDSGAATFPDFTAGMTGIHMLDLPLMLRLALFDKDRSLFPLTVRRRFCFE